MVLDKKGNGKITGTEVLIYSTSSKAELYTKRILNKIADLGFKSRGVKIRTDLAILKQTNSPALLVECCFVDDRDDVDLYNYKKMAKAITEGILGKDLSEKESSVSRKIIYLVQCGVFSKKENAEDLQEKLKKASKASYIY